MRDYFQVKLVMEWGKWERSRKKLSKEVGLSEVWPQPDSTGSSGVGMAPRVVLLSGKGTSLWYPVAVIGCGNHTEKCITSHIFLDGDEWFSETERVAAYTAISSQHWSSWGSCVQAQKKGMGKSTSSTNYTSFLGDFEPSPSEQCFLSFPLGSYELSFKLRAKKFRETFTNFLTAAPFSVRLLGSEGLLAWNSSNSGNSPEWRC